VSFVFKEEMKVNESDNWKENVESDMESDENEGEKATKKDDTG
jgi:hypothetical protein